ncbi:MAG: hypothetical protein HY259_05845 [Chloroflexi bacterium]|nr:hypothetical protein [Chloroflexota bacterium]
MTNTFNKFGGLSAILVGILSILYAVFFLVIARQAEHIGTLGSWLILALSGIFSSAAYVALYRRIAGNGQNDLALWAMLLGVMSSFATLQHGEYQALLINELQGAPGPRRTAIEAVRSFPSQVDPAGFTAFFVVGLVAFIFGWLIVRTGTLPKNLGYLSMGNAVLLIVLFLANVGDIQPLVLLAGGLTSVIVGPIWWIWLGVQLRKEM